jgi:hypothetical protein
VSASNRGFSRLTGVDVVTRVGKHGSRRERRVLLELESTATAQRKRFPSPLASTTPGYREPRSTGGWPTSGARSPTSRLTGQATAASPLPPPAPVHCREWPEGIRVHGGELVAQVLSGGVRPGEGESKQSEPQAHPTGQRIALQHSRIHPRRRPVSSSRFPEPALRPSVVAT